MNRDISRLFRDALIYGSGRYIQQVVGFLLIPLYTRYLVPTDYGIMDTISVFQAMLGLLFVLGLDSAFARYYLDAETRLDKQIVTSTIFIFRLSVITLFSALTYLSSGWLATLFYHQADLQPVFKVVSLLLFANFLYSFFLEALRFNFKATHYALTSVIVTVSTISLTVYLVVFAKWGVMGIFTAQIVALGLIGFPLAFWKIRWSLKPYFSGALLKKLLRYGLPLIPAAISYWVLTHSNRYFLLKFITLDEIGVYAVGEKFVRILVLVVTGFQLAWGPFVFSIYKNKGANDTFKMVFSLYFVVMSTLATIIACFSKELVMLMTQPAYYKAGLVIPWMIFTPVFIGAYYIVSIGVTITKKTKHVGWTTACAAGLNVLLNMLLIPRFGVYGAAFSTSFSYLVSASLLYRVAQSLYPLPYQLKHAFITIVTALLVIYGAHSIPPDFFMAIPLKISMIIGMLGLFGITGIVPLGKLITLLTTFLRRR